MLLANHPFYAVLQWDFVMKRVQVGCCESFLDYLFDDLGLHRVTIHCGVANARSCAIPERLGFAGEGIAREAQWVNDRWVDLVVWSMLDREWRSRRQPPPVA